MKTQASSLAEALEARKTIERAKGILMVKEGLTEAAGLRPPAAGEPEVGPPDEGDRRRGHRDAELSPIGAGPAPPAPPTAAVNTAAASVLRFDCT